VVVLFNCCLLFQDAEEEADAVSTVVDLKIKDPEHVAGILSCLLYEVLL
jgi:hypothetical protein